MHLSLPLPIDSPHALQSPHGAHPSIFVPERNTAHNPQRGRRTVVQPYLPPPSLYPAPAGALSRPIPSVLATPVCACRAPSRGRPPSPGHVRSPRATVVPSALRVESELTELCLVAPRRRPTTVSAARGGLSAAASCAVGRPCVVDSPRARNAPPHCGAAGCACGSTLSARGVDRAK